MNTREEASPRRSRFGIASAAVVGLCALACLVPVVSAFVAGTVLDRVLDSPLGFTVLFASGVCVAAFAYVRHRAGARHGC